MTDVQELGRRAVACKHWRWMPGMVTTDGKRVLAAYKDSLVVASQRNDTSLLMVFRLDAITYSPFPDLSDPATLGCLLALVREVWDKFVWVGYSWRIDGTEGHQCHTIGHGSIVGTFSATEAETLVAALEAAP